MHRPLRRALIAVTTLLGPALAAATAPDAPPTPTTPTPAAAAAPPAAATAAAGAAPSAPPAAMPPARLRVALEGLRCVQDDRDTGNEPSIRQMWMQDGEMWSPTDPGIFLDFQMMKPTGWGILSIDQASGSARLDDGETLMSQTRAVDGIRVFSRGDSPLVSQNAPAPKAMHLHFPLAQEPARLLVSLQGSVRVILGDEASLVHVPLALHANTPVRIPLITEDVRVTLESDGRVSFDYHEGSLSGIHDFHLLDAHGAAVQTMGTSSTINNNDEKVTVTPSAPVVSASVGLYQVRRAVTLDLTFTDLPLAARLDPSLRSRSCTWRPAAMPTPPAGPSSTVGTPAVGGAGGNVQIFHMQNGVQGHLVIGGAAIAAAPAPAAPAAAPAAATAPTTGSATAPAAAHP